ncbi:hypothetical protein SAMN04488136_1581, partial [Vibrio xiamenensis]
NQAQLEAYYEGANAALCGNSDNVNHVFEHPSCEIGDAFRKGHAAQLAAMSQDSSIV